MTSCDKEILIQKTCRRDFVSVEEDADGLEPRMLEARFEGTVQLDKWCACSLCRTQLLTDAIEYRCCQEVGPTLHKLVFDGSIEKISCVTLHEEYTIMTHATVLKNVGSLLRDQDGRSYKRRRIHENEYLRAVAYRWVIRWLCGCLGWENSRPLPACIYTDIRKRFPLRNPLGQEHAGYKSAQERN
ncbi:uncharacterized protein LOC124440421 [Xenia sp. Carnegie-2017]|uniref:uncharacterized protein LOC124440421 n=1 Tax=Xenia sp. Carnegie-2017 TaxID=2897299 RepID=UPI001F0433F6|nr:uncharacterized protein LOC124440421 [Xenia sp. Carnegie-2017]